tara:strand:+ start:449 stop:748 length:300 start_codon:yes stop_codon:yes gene_type:complete
MPIKMDIKKSTAKGKKWTAVFSEPDGKKIKTTQFGGKGFLDYTIGASEEQRRAYKARHGNMLKKTDSKSASHLSYYLLWGESRSLASNISAYKKRFGFK